MKRILLSLLCVTLSYPMFAEDKELKYEGSVSTFMYMQRPDILSQSSGVSVHTSHGVRMLNDILYIGGSIEYIYEKYESLTYALHLKCNYPVKSKVAAFIGCEAGGQTYRFTKNTDLVITPSLGVSFNLKHDMALELSGRAMFDMYHEIPVMGAGLTFRF